MSQDQPDAVKIEGEGLRFAIVASRYNRLYVDALLENAVRVLNDAGVRSDDVEVVRVPGALEIPYAANMLGASGDFDCIIALGVVIEGDTSHHEVIAYSTADAFMRIGKDHEIPVVNGVIDVHNTKQAQDRCMGSMNRGAEFAHTALEMAELKVQLVRRLDEIYEEDQVEKQKSQWTEFFDDSSDQPWKS
jgi:6,7-dimethyl-8-ribityllumazine synthase